MNKTTERKIEAIREQANKEIAAIFKVEIDRNFKSLKKKYPFIAGVKVCFINGDYLFYAPDAPKVMIHENDDPTVAVPESVTNFLREAIGFRDSYTDTTWIEYAKITAEPEVIALGELLDRYEESNGKNFTI